MRRRPRGTCASRSTPGSVRRCNPAQTTTRYAYFRAVSISGRTQAFQPLLGCIPTQGGGGRSTVSARVVPVGQPLEFRSRIVVVGPGDVKFLRVACLKSETLVGAWHAIAFRTKQPPDLARVGLVQAHHEVARQEGGRDRVVDRRPFARRARDRPGRCGVRAVSSRLPVSPAAAARCACGGVRRLVARAPASSLRGRLHEPRSARVGGGAAAQVAVARSARTLPPRARVRGNRRRKAAGDGRAGDVRPRDGGAARRRLRLDACERREADPAARRSACDVALRRQGAEKVRIGLISFSTGPDILVPPTTDRALLQEGIDLLEPEGGTAIGDGLGVAVQVVRSAVGDVKKSKDGKIPGAIVLLSDGAQTRGDLTPLQGADRAKRAGIRVFTVALGTNHGTLSGGGSAASSAAARAGSSSGPTRSRSRRLRATPMGRRSARSRPTRWSRSTRSSARASPASREPRGDLVVRRRRRAAPARLARRREGDGRAAAVAATRRRPATARPGRSP